MKLETFGIKYKYCNCFLEYMNFKDDLTEYKFLCWTKSYQHKFDEKLKERFFNTYKFCNHDNNKFVSVLFPKDLYLYETSLPEKEDFYSHLNKEDITDADYAHAKIICKDFEIKNVGEYYGFYV